MKKIKILILLLLSPVVFAQENSLSKQFSSCINKSNGVTTKMVSCISEETKSQDMRLNKNYNNLIKKLTTNKKTQLQEVQKIWIKYRDSSCGFLSDFTGGTIDRINSNECYLNETAKRADELSDLQGIN